MAPSKSDPHIPISTRGFLPLKDAAQWASISVKTLERWMARGLPAYHAGAGTKRLVRTADIEQFLTRQQTAKPDLNRMVDEVSRDLVVKVENGKKLS